MTRFRLAAVLGFASSLFLLPVMGSVTAASASTGAAASTGTVTYRGTPGSAARVTHATSVTGLPKVALAFRNEGPLMFTPLRPGGASSAASRKASAAAAVTGVTRDAVSGAGQGAGSVIHKFNGLSDLNSDSLNGFPVTPPDQGLCVGRDATLAGAL